MGMIKFQRLALIMIFVCSLGSLEALAAGQSVMSLEHPSAKPFSTGLLHLNHYNGEFQQTFYSLNLNLQKKLGKKTSYNIDAFGLLKVQGEGASSYSVRELYYNRKVSSKFNYSIGRKIENWSNLERYMPTGSWNNSWDFNKAQPLEEGLFGAFGSYKLSKRSSLTFFASPISAPKLTSHHAFNDDGSIEVNTPWFKAPPATVDYEGVSYSTKYSLDLDIPSIALNPQAGFIYDLKGERSFLKTSYMYAPSKELDLGIDFSLNASEEDIPIDITVEPEASYMHRLSVDVGHQWSKSSQTIVNVNLTERAEALSVDPENKKSYVGLDPGFMYQLFHSTFFFKKKLKTTFHLVENTRTESVSSGELDSFLLDSLSVPFRYRRGVGADLSFKLGKNSSFSAYTYYDVKSKGVMGDFKVETSLKRISLAAGLNFVEALNSESTGFYKDFRENDSIYVRASYVF